MRTFILTLLITLSSIFFYGQIAIGGGFELEDGDTGIQLRADIPVSDALSINPYLTYFFPDKASIYGEEYKITFTSIGGDLHYNFNVGDKFKLFPLLGISYDMYSYKDGYDSSNDFKDGKMHLNLGGGASYSFTDNLQGYAEAKYRGQIEGISLDIGLLFSFGEAKQKSTSSTKKYSKSSASSTSKNCKPAISKIDKFTEQEIVAWGGKLGSSRNLFQGVSQNLKLYMGVN